MISLFNVVLARRNNIRSFYNVDGLLMPSSSALRVTIACLHIHNTNLEEGSVSVKIRIYRRMMGNLLCRRLSYTQNRSTRGWAGRSG